jgi:phosphate starvation-inducible PhoH-like protein
MEARIELRDVEEELALLGNKDHWRRRLHDRFGIEVVSRGGQLRLIGDEAGVEAARQLIERALVQLRAGSQPTALAEALDRLLQAPARVEHETSGGERAASDAAAIQVLARGVKPRTAGQGRYVESLRDFEITIAVGPAGTGKTFLAVAAAVARLRRGEFRKLVLARPAVEAGERLGFLPGDLQAKVNPYLRPLYDSLFLLLDPAQVQRYIETDVIEIVPLAYMRGRTLDRAFIILDEAQNTTPQQMKMFLTRMGEGSRIVVTGDPTQTDLPPGQLSGLTHALRVLGDLPGISVVRLERSDIVRHPLVQRIVEAYEDSERGAGGGADSVPPDGAGGDAPSRESRSSRPRRSR